MSLLNDVLKELDRRQATPDPGSGLTSGVRHVEAPRGPLFGHLRPLLLGLLLVAAGLLALLTGTGRPDWMARIGATSPTHTPPPSNAIEAITTEILTHPLAAATVATTAEPEIEATPEPEPATPRVSEATTGPAAPLPAKEPRPAPVESPPEVTPTTTLATGSDSRPATAVLKQSTPFQRAQSLAERARIGLTRGDQDSAIQQLEEALDIEPLLDSARHLLVVTYLETGRPAVALAHLAKGLDMQPNDHFLLVVRTRIALDDGDAQAAAASARDALSRHAESDALHGLLALALLAGGQPEAALVHFQRVLDNDPFSPQGLIGLAAALEQSGQSALARQALLRALGSERLSPAQRVHVKGRLEAIGHP